MTKDGELFRFDERLGRRHSTPLAGIDEAGRGPLAGPVVAAAVLFHRRVSLPGLRDSKKLSPQLREKLFYQILLHAWVGIGRVYESVIDQINILQATRRAMREAVLALPRTPRLLLIDGKISLDLPIPQRSIVGGDDQSASIAAASVMAKVHRDFLMKDLDRVYPRYGFAIHKGYPTPSHLKALRRQGPSEIHRKSFAPVARMLRK